MNNEETVGMDTAMESGDKDAVVLPRRVAIQLMHEAQIRSDEEACGLIAEDPASGARVVYPVPNVAQDRAHAFEMDPKRLVAVHRTMRERGQSLWAVYHSHPQGDATPSAADLRETGHPEAVQIIVSLDIRGVLQLRAWRFSADGPREQRLTISDE